MWKASVINWISNLFGTVAGVPQIIEGYFFFQSGDIPHGIAKIAEGIGIFAIGYFTGKSTLNLEAGKGTRLGVFMVCVLGFPLMGNTVVFAQSTPAIPLTIAKTNALISSGLTGGDATIVISDDTTRVRPAYALSSIKFNVTVAGTVSSTYTLEWMINTPLTGVSTISYPYFFDMSNFGSWTANLYVSEDSSFTNYYTFKPMNTYPNVGHIGWNLVTVNTNKPNTMTGSPSKDNIFTRIRLSVIVPAGVTGAIYIGEMYANAKSRPKVSVVLDDNHLTLDSIAYDYMKKFNLVGSLSLVTSRIGDVAYIPSSRLQDMYARGWSMHSQSTQNQDLTALTKAQVITDITTSLNTLKTYGLVYGNSTFTIPNGLSNATVESALEACNLKYARGAGANRLAFTWDGFDNPYRIDSHSTDISFTKTQLLDRLDDTITYGASIIYIVHCVLVGAGAGCTEYDTFVSLIDAIKTKRDQGLIDVVTLQNLVDSTTLNENLAKERRLQYAY